MAADRSGPDMFRQKIAPRKNWRDIAEKNGFHFHHVNGELYWDESVFYQFSLEQIEKDLEDPARELHEMCVSLVDEACHNQEILKKLKIPEKFWDKIIQSWQKSDFSLYGRFDFSYDGKHSAKLLEYNADTPTSVYEAAFFQWLWLEDCIKSGTLPKEADQFNSIQENLCAVFLEIKKTLKGPMHFASVKDTEEDRATVEYLMDCAIQSGINARFVYMEDIGLDNAGVFFDLDNKKIDALFKLYPWEYIWEDKFADALLKSDVILVEPAWKMILSNKGILPLLWERHEGHPNLLPAFFADEKEYGFGHVKKPMLGREGANITIMDSDAGVICSDGEYGKEGFVWQKECRLPDFSGNYPVCGVWIANGKSCGLGIREDKSPITKDTSRFVPHAIIS